MFGCIICLQVWRWPSVWLILMGTRTVILASHHLQQAGSLEDWRTHLKQLPHSNISFAVEGKMILGNIINILPRSSDWDSVAAQCSVLCSSLCHLPWWPLGRGAVGWCGCGCCGVVLHHHHHCLSVTSNCGAISTLFYTYHILYTKSYIYK